MAGPNGTASHADTRPMLKLGALVEETRDVEISRPNPKAGQKGEPEYVEVVLTAWWFPTVRATVKAQLRALSDAYNARIRPDPEDIDPEDGRPRYKPNQDAWEHYIAGSLKLLVPEMTGDEAAHLANYGHSSEQGVEVLRYVGYMAAPAEPATPAEGAPDPEAVAAMTARLVAMTARVVALEAVVTGGSSLTGQPLLPT